ncbi:unnamed protein product [Ixodes pacificus]
MVFPQRHSPQRTTRRSGICGGRAHASPPPHRWRSGRGHGFCSTLWQGTAACEVSSLATEKTGGLTEARPARTSLSVGMCCQLLTELAIQMAQGICRQEERDI